MRKIREVLRLHFELGDGTAGDQLSSAKNPYAMNL